MGLSDPTRGIGLKLFIILNWCGADSLKVVKCYSPIEKNVECGKTMENLWNVILWEPYKSWMTNMAALIHNSQLLLALP